MTAQEISQRHTKLYLPARDGRLFHAATAATGVAPGTAIGTTAAFSLHNPVDSGVELAILLTSLGYISGTLGAGLVWHLINNDPTAAAPTGTAIVPIPGKVNGPGSKAKPLTTATLAVAPKIVRPFCSLGASLASTALGPAVTKDDVEGAIIIPPGCTYSLNATAAAGTSPLVAFGVDWEENTIGVD